MKSSSWFLMFSNWQGRICHCDPLAHWRWNRSYQFLAPSRSPYKAAFSTQKLGPSGSLTYTSLGKMPRIHHLYATYCQELKKEVLSLCLVHKWDSQTGRSPWRLIVHSLALTLLPVFDILSVFSVITHMVLITSAFLEARGTDFMTLNLKIFSSSAFLAAMTSGLS